VIGWDDGAGTAPAAEGRAVAELTRPEVDPPSGPAPDGLVIEDLVVGDGAEATPGS
jgi:hypothetical protein